MLQGQIDYSLGESQRRRISYETAGYAVPEVPSQIDFLATYDRPGAVPPAPGQAPAAPTTTPKYAVGQQIVIGGKKYKVTKIDPNNPDDPDVEEIQ